MNPVKNDVARAEHINTFVIAFVKKAKRMRYLEFLLDPKKRRKIIENLNHKLADDLNEATISNRQPSNMNVLEQRRDVKVYLIADNRELDDHFLPLWEALDTLRSSHFGLIVSFIPGKLAAYKPESPSTTIWLVND